MRRQLLSTSANRLPTGQVGKISEIVSGFESDTVAVFQRTAPANEHIILYSLLAMAAVFVILAAFVKLDRVVNGMGRIVTAAGSLYVSPFDTGIVREVHVKAGDVVRKGQRLATLDPTFAHADLVQLQEKRASDQAEVMRLEAEVAGRLYEYSTTDSHQSLQGSIWQKRASEYQSNLADFDARLRNTQAQIDQARADVNQYTKRLKLATDVESVYQPLIAKGYVSKLQMMQATDQRTELARLLADANGAVEAQGQLLESLRAQRAAYVDKWHSDTSASLVASRNDLDATQGNLEKAQRMSELSSLDAPQDAVVLKVGKISSGSVAAGGQMEGAEPLFTLVPLDAPVEADITVEAQDIGFIKVGDSVQLKLDAYRYLQHGIAKGIIKSISEGSFTADENGVPTTPYFRVRVKITEAKLRNVPNDFRLVPGMTVVGDILVGQRTILSYLVEGALRTGSEAMREP